MSSWLSSQVSPIWLIGVQRVLSVAGWWMTVVYSVQDETSGPFGPRFKGRDATLAQAGIASGQGISVGLLLVDLPVRPDLLLVGYLDNPSRSGAVPGGVVRSLP